MSTYCNVCSFNNPACQHTLEAEHAALVAEYAAIQFPCKIKFIIVPYIGMPRSAVYDCADQAQLDAFIDFYMSDTTGNTRKVTHSVYVPPQTK